MAINEDGSLVVWMPDGSELELSCVTLEGEDVEHLHDIAHMRNVVARYAASQDITQD